METEIHKLLFEYDAKPLASKEERAIYELIKIVIRQEEKIKELQNQINFIKFKTRIGDC